MVRSPPRKPADRSPPHASQPGDCATQVLEVVPAAMDALRAAMRNHVGEQLSVPQFRCLNFIARHPGASVSAVATFLGVTLPTASAMVDRLVRAGAVQPSTDTVDRRRSQLHITDAGRAQLRQIRLGASDELTRKLATRSADELKTLQDGLSVLRLAFQPE